MSVSTNIRIKIALLMAKFDSPITVQRKLKVKFGKNAPKKDCILAMFQHFCESGTIKHR